MTNEAENPYAGVSEEIASGVTAVIEDVIAAQADLDHAPTRLIVEVFHGMSLCVASLMANAIQAGNDRAGIEAGFAKVIGIHLDNMLKAEPKESSIIVPPTH